METMVIEDDIPVPKPGPGEILVKIRAVGLSYMFVCHPTDS
jgi:NADPH:quinone reductase-like Zn-dependent oxidoreductase